MYLKINKLKIMYEIKEHFINTKGKGKIEVNIDDDTVVTINSRDNSNMKFETFNQLCREGYSFLFDFTKKIKNTTDDR